MLQRDVSVFPPHLNNVSTLLCETWNAHRALATIALLYRETPQFIPPQLWPLNSPNLNPVDNSVWEILQKRYTTHASLICSYRRRHWRMAAAMTMWSSLVHSILSRCFSLCRIPDQWCVFCTPSLAVFPHAVIDWFWSFFIWQLTGSTCVMRISSFTR